MEILSYLTLGSTWVFRSPVFKNRLQYIFVCVRIFHGMCVEDRQIGGAGSFFYHVGPGDYTQVVMLVADAFTH